LRADRDEQQQLAEGEPGWPMPGAAVSSLTGTVYLHVRPQPARLPAVATTFSPDARRNGLINDH
jgi:hypothetical protein